MAKRGRPPKGAALPLSDLPDLLSFWNNACAAPNGLAIASTNPNRLAQRLYAARRLAGHNAYDHLKVVERETEVWIQPR